MKSFVFVPKWYIYMEMMFTCGAKFQIVLYYVARTGNYKYPVPTANS